MGRIQLLFISVVLFEEKKNVLTALRCIFIHAFLSICSNVARYPQFSPPFPPCSGRGMIGKGSILPFKFFHSGPIVEPFVDLVDSIENWFSQK